MLEAVKNPDGASISSPRVGPSAVGADGRMDKSSTVNLSRNDKSTTERSPILNGARAEKSPMLMADSIFAGDNPSGNATTTLPPQLLVDVDRIPKRLLQRLKARPELSSVNWTADTGNDTSAPLVIDCSHSVHSGSYSDLFLLDQL